MPTFVTEDHMLDWHKCQICYPLEIKLLLLELLGEEIYNNQNNHKPNNRNRRADETLVDRVNTLMGLGAILTAPLNRTKSVKKC